MSLLGVKYYSFMSNNSSVSEQRKNLAGRGARHPLGYDDPAFFEVDYDYTASFGDGEGQHIPEEELDVLSELWDEVET